MRGSGDRRPHQQIAQPVYRNRPGSARLEGGSKTHPIPCFINKQDALPPAVVSSKMRSSQVGPGGCAAVCVAHSRAPAPRRRPPSWGRCKSVTRAQVAKAVRCPPPCFPDAGRNRGCEARHRLLPGHSENRKEFVHGVKQGATPPFSWCGAVHGGARPASFRLAPVTSCARYLGRSNTWPG